MLSWDVDSGIASQMGIGVVAGEVIFAGIFVALVIVIEIVMGFIVVHGSTFLVCCSPCRAGCLFVESKLRRSFGSATGRDW